MKLTFSIVLCFLLGCPVSEEEKSQNRIPKDDFVNVLKQIHLAEGIFELNKGKNIKKARNYLAFQYDSIYNTYKTNQIIFEYTLSYYIEHPNELEETYSTILEELIKERSNLP